MSDYHEVRYSDPTTELFSARAFGQTTGFRCIEVNGPWRALEMALKLARSFRIEVEVWQDTSHGLRRRVVVYADASVRVTL